MWYLTCISGDPGEDVTRTTGSTSQQARQQSREGKVVVVPVLNPDGTPAKDADGKVYNYILLTVISMILKLYTTFVFHWNNSVSVSSPGFYPGFYQGKIMTIIDSDYSSGVNPWPQISGSVVKGMKNKLWVETQISKSDWSDLMMNLIFTDQISEIWVYAKKIWFWGQGLRL